MPTATDSQTAIFGVAAYSFPCSYGLTLRNHRPAVDKPMDAWTLIGLAAQYRLSSVEMPLSILPDRSPATIERLRATCEEYRLGLVIDTGIVQTETLAPVLLLAARAGARTVRALLSSTLEGARGDLAAWQARLDEIRSTIDALLPVLEQHDLVLALENHQDATSDDLLAFCEAGAGRVGVTFDVANPLAVAEEPFAFARKLGSHIRNVHLKDYRIFPTPSGYRLVRCALGEGVIAWPEMLTLLEELAPAATQHIELAALYGRHIRLFESQWWDGFPPRDVREVLPALQLMAGHAQPAGAAWQTGWERDEPGEQVARWEHEQFETSVRYLRSITADREVS